MRSQLLISVAYLPTIKEDVEVKSQCEETGTDPQTSNGLEEYVKSIQTLAQPSSLTTDLMHQGQLRSQGRNRLKLRSSLRGCEGRVLNPAKDANVIALQASADPLAWLYRQSGKENQESKALPTATRLTLPQILQPANPLNLYKKAEACRRQPSSKDQPSEIKKQQERRSRPQRLQKKCRSTSYHSRGANSRLHKPQLPVIYEL
ncbi:protein DEPP1 [Rhinophrynus dorsalis]